MTDALVPTIAKLTITWNGQQGDLPDHVSYDMTDADIKQVITETIQHAGIPGIDRDPNINLQDFVVDRFPAREDLPVNRLLVRPKTPFGQ